MLRKTDIVLLYYTASWCAPCKVYKPLLRKVAEDMGLKVMERDVDEHVDTATDWGVMSVPTTIVLNMNDDIQEVEEKDRLVGAFPETILRQRLEKVLLG